MLEELNSKCENHSGELCSVELDMLECDFNYKLFAQKGQANQNQRLPCMRGSKSRAASQPAPRDGSGKENLQSIKCKRLPPIDVPHSHVVSPPTALHNRFARNRRFAPPPRRSVS
jgi:hypothetical protein